MIVMIRTMTKRPLGQKTNNWTLYPKATRKSKTNLNLLMPRLLHPRRQLLRIVREAGRQPDTNARQTLAQNQENLRENPSVNLGV